MFMVGLVFGLAGCSLLKPSSSQDDKGGVATAPRTALPAFDLTNASAIQISVRKPYLGFPSGKYNPNGNTMLVASATMKDGTTRTDIDTIWKAVDVTTSLGKITVDPETSVTWLECPDPVANVDKSVTITATAKSRPDLTASMTLEPHYGNPRLEIHMKWKKDPATNTLVSPDVTATVSYLARPSGSGQLVLVSCSMTDGSSQVGVFDPALAKPIVIRPLGNPFSGGTGGNATIVCDPAHPELKDAVKLDKSFHGVAGKLVEGKSAKERNAAPTGPCVNASGQRGDSGENGKDYVAGQGGPGKKGDDAGAVTITLTLIESDAGKSVHVTGDAGGNPVDLTFDPDKDRLTVMANGGDGGTGGDGGRGRDTGQKNVGGTGGRGGKGGKGGKGGRVTVFYDAAHPELKDLVDVSNGGGPGGDGGRGGQPGAGGTSGNNGDDGAKGDDGADGPEPVFKPKKK
jgi:hypothetical protein